MWSFGWLILWDSLRASLGFKPRWKITSIEEVANPDPVTSVTLSPESRSVFDEAPGETTAQPEGDLSAVHVCDGLKGMVDEVQVIRWGDQERLVLTKTSPMTIADRESISQFAKQMLGSGWRHRVYLLDGFSLAIERIPAMNFHPNPNGGAVLSHDLGGEA